MVKNRATGENFYADNYYDRDGGGVQQRHHAEVNGSWTFSVRAQNDGDVSDDLVVRGQTSPSFQTQYFVGYFDITAAVTNGGLTFPNVPPGGSVVFAVRESGPIAGPLIIPAFVTVHSGLAPRFGFSDAVTLGLDSGT